MAEQEAVNQAAEFTASMESAPIENQPTTPQSSPADALVEPERNEVGQVRSKVSESVPYDRFAEVNAEKQQLKAELDAIRAQQTPSVPLPVSYGNAPFDPETQAGLEAFWEAKKAQDFATRHAAELTDPLVAGTTQRLIAEANAKGQRMDQEQALSQAQSMIEARLKPKVAEQVKESFEEGQQIARTKQELGAVGESKAAPKVDPNNLSSAEFAAHFNLPRGD